MRFHTLLTERFGIPIPIALSPLPNGISSPELVGAASKNGMLGILDGSDLSPKALRKAIRKVRRRGRKRPFGVHLNIPEFPNVSSDRMAHTYRLLTPFCEKLGLTSNSLPEVITPLFEEQMLVILKERVPFFSFSNGALHPEWVKLLRGSGTVLMGTATSVAEAHYLEEIGLHMIRMQGREASGVRGDFLQDSNEDALTLKELLLETMSAVSVPLIVEGGIMTGSEVLDFLNAGAAGVSMGTAFLAAKESGAPAAHKKMLLQQGEEDNTVLSTVFTGRIGRVLPNKLTDWAEHHPFEILEHPMQKCLMLPILEAAKSQDLLDYLPLWSNGRSHLCREGKMRDLIENILTAIYDIVNTNQ